MIIINKHKWVITIITTARTLHLRTPTTTAIATTIATAITIRTRTVVTESITEVTWMCAVILVNALLVVKVAALSEVDMLMTPAMEDQATLT